jgi:hypothetical protein
MQRRLRELQRLWLIEATKYNVLPLDDRRIERFNADLAGRPQLVKGNSQLLFGGMGRLSENSVLVPRCGVRGNVVRALGGLSGTRTKLGPKTCEGNTKQHVWFLSCFRQNGFRT